MSLPTDPRAMTNWAAQEPSMEAWEGRDLGPQHTQYAMSK